MTLIGAVLARAGVGLARLRGGGERPPSSASSRPSVGNGSVIGEGAMATAVDLATAACDCDLVNFGGLLPGLDPRLMRS